jgi:hypothetical protein
MWRASPEIVANRATSSFILEAVLTEAGFEITDAKDGTGAFDYEPSIGTSRTLAELQNTLERVGQWPTSPRIYSQHHRQ